MAGKLQVLPETFQKIFSYEPSQVVTFADNQATAYIMLNISADNIPELDEDFVVSLVSVDNSGKIDQLKNSVSFVIRYFSSFAQPKITLFIFYTGHNNTVFSSVVILVISL